MKNQFLLNHLNLVKSFLISLIIFTGITAQESADNSFVEYLVNDKIIKDKSIKIAEFELYLKNLYRNELSEKIAFITANYYLNENSPEKALFYYAYILFFNKNSLYSESTFDKLDSLLTYKVNTFSKADPALLLQKVKSHSAKKETAFLFLDYIDFLSSVNSKNIDRLSLEFCNTFFEKKMANKINDAVIFWIARLYQRLGNKPQATLKYMKCYNLYKSSAFAPQAALQAANLIKNYYKNYRAALDLYIEVINTYPDTEYAGNAQYFMAKTFRLYLNDPEEAINQYRIQFTLFPENKYADSSHYEMAELLYEIKKYQESLQAYISFIEETSNQNLLLDAVLKVYNILDKHFSKSETQATTLLYMARLVKTENEKIMLYTKAAEIFRILGQTEKAQEIKNKLKELSG